MLEASCGNGAASVFLAEEFHLYARGFDAAFEIVEGARAIAERSAAARRVRFFHDEVAGPADALCCLREPAPDPALVRRGGTVVWGRFVADDVAADPPANTVWRREATPIEWERYYAPQERALRAYRRTLRDGDEVSPVALEAERRIDRFRSSRLAYELAVFRS